MENNLTLLPLVSICIPAYNHQEYIEETINSIISQTYKNIELIIINDGSTDNTNEKIKKLSTLCEKRFVRFEYIFRENKGLMKTLQELSSKVNGKYFAVVASDDFFDRTKIEKQVNILEKNTDYAMCYTRMVGVNSESKVIKHYKTKYNASGHIFDKLLMRNFIPALSVLLKKEVFENVGGYDMSYKFEDYPLWLRIANKYKIYFLNEELSFYREHESNMSKNFTSMSFEIEKILNSWSGSPYYPKAMDFFYLSKFREFVNLKDKETAAYYMGKCNWTNWFKFKFVRLVIKYLFIK